MIMPNGTAISMSKKMFSSSSIFKLVWAFPSLYVWKRFLTSLSRYGEKFRNDETIISSISVTDIVFDD